ncbi:hypothetical protein [Candidatus Methylomirabilis sp.]|uniref:hypothetical protein n=1 Tax=Candidatus Methylomirabilis sp. TaxID=2032687 RepID=UPI003C75F32F
MKRADSIEALLKKARTDFARLKDEYNASLHEKHVRNDLKVSIKNIFENLRSCLDYLAHDIFEAHCANAKKPGRLYFPIRPSAPEFGTAITKEYPALQTTAPKVYDLLEAVQPYRDPWLGQFNKLNNHNKHQDLVEQSRTETRQVTVSRGGGSVSWGPGVTFGSGVSVMGVPIDPRTQMPVPNTVAKTEVVTWIDFRFREIDQSVLPFIDASIANVDKLFRSLQPHV